jgi:hypothetical protein
VADEAVNAAAQTRKTSAWLASGLGAIPSLAIVGALVRAPGDYGFDDNELALGIFCAALGALVGLLAFAWVIGPLKLTDKSLTGFDIQRLPGHHYEDARELLDELGAIKRAARSDRRDAKEALRRAEGAQAEASAAEREALNAELEAKANPSDADKQATAARLRATAADKKLEGEESVAAAAAAAVTVSIWGEQVRARERLRADALRLTAADEVGTRFVVARVVVVAAVALVAAGFYFLALAPIEKTVAAPAKAPELVRWVPSSPQGTEALGCDVAAIRGLQIVGDDGATRVITFPIADCPEPKVVVFPVETETSLGTVTVIQPVTTAAPQG